MSSLHNNFILEIRNIEKRYGDIHAVNNISLEILNGEFLTLLGPSGSGKTTLLLMIAGFEYSTQGEIMLQGKSIGLKLPEERNIGMVFQNYALFPHMTIFENIAFPLRMRKMKKPQIRDIVRAVLSLVKLDGYENRYPKQLSGGQQQRIALARAIVFEPALLLMDEPLGALDKKLREHMQLEIKHIWHRLKVTVIYVTHDQEEALVMSDRIVVMNEGKVEQIGTPDEIYEKPVNKFVASFIGESNFIEGKIINNNGDVTIIRFEDGSEHSLNLGVNVKPGENVCFCIRPEKIILTNEGSPQGSILKGIVKEVIYVGEILRYKINVGREKILNVRQMSIEGGDRYKEGEMVNLCWDIKNLRKL